MNLTELCSCIPKQIVKDAEAVQILAVSMETASKVYKNGVIYQAETDEQDQQIQKAIEEEISDFNVEHILWKGIYGDAPKTVEYWFFMHSLLIIRGVDGRWALMTKKIHWKKWKKWKKEISP